MSVSIGTNIGPVRVSKRLGRGHTPTATGSAAGDAVLLTGGVIVGAVSAVPAVVVAMLGVIALFITGYWAIVATSLALAFSALAGIAFALSRVVPGTRTWGMRFSRAARWSWTSIPALFRKVSVKR